MSYFIIIGPESDHWLCLSLTHSCLANLIDLTVACEDANSKLVEVVADVSDEDCVRNSLLQIWKLKLFSILLLMFGSYAK